jgi:hypothetical protein
MRHVFLMLLVAIIVVLGAVFLWLFTYAVIGLVRVLEALHLVSISDRIVEWMDNRFMPFLDHISAELEKYASKTEKEDQA